MKLTLPVEVGLYLKSVRYAVYANMQSPLILDSSKFSISSIRESLYSTQMYTEPPDESFIVETKCNRLKTANCPVQQEYDGEGKIRHI